GPPGMLLKHVLREAGIDLERDGVQVFRAPSPPGNWARVGADAIENGIADAFWGNAMRAEWGVRRGIATILLDIRRGDGPPAALKPPSSLAISVRCPAQYSTSRWSPRSFASCGLGSSGARRANDDVRGSATDRRSGGQQIRRGSSRSGHRVHLHRRAAGTGGAA